MTMLLEANNIDYTLLFNLEYFQKKSRVMISNVNPFHGRIEKKYGNTNFIINTMCEGTESLSHKVQRLIFSDKGELCYDK